MSICSNNILKKNLSAMKHSFSAVALMIAVSIFTPNIYAQTNLSGRSGLYLTAEDYANKKLSYSNENSNRRYKIKVGLLFHQDRVQIIQNGKKHNFYPFDLFGYRNKNQDYRFSYDQQYKIVDTSFFYMYTRDVIVNEGKANIKKTNYYFSKRSDGDIMDLTLDNLKKAASKNHKFRDLLDVYFRSDDELSRYDSFNKMYKVEHILGDTFDKTAYTINK